MRKTAVATVTALSLMAAPAFAQETEEPKGQTTSPAKLCKNESKKKDSAGKGKTLFAKCVSGAKKANAQIEANVAREAAGEKPKRVAPGQFCKNESRKKVAGAPKSPFAACVAGAVAANKAAREAAKEQSAPAPTA